MNYDSKLFNDQNEAFHGLFRMNICRLLILLSLQCLAPFLAEAADAAQPAGQSIAAANARGEWKWLTTGRNGQPEETTLKIDVAPDGTVTGTITDRSGPHRLTNASLKGANVEFTIQKDTPNGKVPVTYALKLDARDPKIVIEYPDSKPAAKRAGKNRRIEANAARVDADPKK